VSNLYPPVVRGGYEVECSSVVERLRAGHDVTVLTSSHDGRAVATQPGVHRALPLLDYTKRDSLRAPIAALVGARVMRRTLAAVAPDLVFCWNGAQIPQAALRVALDSATPVAFRVCEHWFGHLFLSDQFMRHLVPGDRGVRRAWAGAMRLVNRHPLLRADALRPAPAAVSWNSETIRRLAGRPPAVAPVLERVIHSTPRFGPVFAAAARRPSERVEIAFLGRVDERKGAEVAARALIALRDRHGIAAVLRTAGTVEPAVAARLDALRVSVELLGPRPPEDLAALLAQAHILVIPSVWEDPFPLVCIEGALARVPIVASRIGGIPECLHDEEHALLVPPADPDALAAAIARTLGEPEATAARVARARARADDFSLERYLASSERFVEDALEALREPAISS
jgi:glycosyltransferase involved in cell wall biosynthesis